MADPTGLRYQRNTRMLNPAPKNVGGRVPKPTLILTLSPQGCDEGRGLYRWPETTNIYITIQHTLTNSSRENDRLLTVGKIHTMPRLALVVHKTVKTSSNVHISSSIECSIAMTQLETSIERKNILPKRTSHEHNQKPGWETSGHNVGNVVKHNSESEVYVITIFGNYNVASWGT